MPQNATSKRNQRSCRQWWLGGEEECPHCGQLYTYEAEFRCPDCDGPICMHCVLIYAGRAACPGCSGHLDGSATREDR